MNGSVVFGLLSALTWGAGDFCGGLAAKRSSLLSVIVCSQIAGAILLILTARVVAEPVPSLPILLVGGVAGILGDIGLMALYSALSRGKMGVAAPVSAVVAAMIPVLFAAVAEGLPGALQAAGFVLAMTGIWLVARSESSAMRLADLGMPIVAGIGFGLFYIVINQVSVVAVYWPLAAARVASVAILSAAALILRRPLLPAAGQLPIIVASGLLDAGGNVFFALAALAGRLDIAAVLASLYPATTVVLAGLFLHERLSRPQTFGVVATLAAIALIVL